MHLQSDIINQIQYLNINEEYLGFILLNKYETKEHIGFNGKGSFTCYEFMYDDKKYKFELGYVSHPMLGTHYIDCTKGLDCEEI